MTLSVCLSGVSLINSVISSDLFITTQGEGNVQVKNMDCDVCTVHTEMGNCLLHSVKVGVASGKSDTSFVLQHQRKVFTTRKYSTPLLQRRRCVLIHQEGYIS